LQVNWQRWGSQSLPLCCANGFDSGQQHSLHRCLPQFFLWPQGLLQRNSSFETLKHSTIWADELQRHLCSTRTKQGRHSPSWHVTLHLWTLHGSFLLQTLSQVGIGSEQLALISCSLVFPQWHVVTFPGMSSHSSQGPGWHISLQAWFPQVSL
jgi:hypothetical protein